MQTLYIDVYFLINFSVDILAMYFASRVLCHHIHILRLLLSGAISALSACLFLLYFEGNVFGYLQLIFSYLISTRICTRKKELWKWMALSLLFVFISFLIGGVVFWGYEKLNNLLTNLNIETNNGAENREMLIFSILILFSICVLHILISFLERKRATRPASVSFSLFGRKYQTEALVDTGCFLVEPLSNLPVLLVKKEFLNLPSTLSVSDISFLENEDWDVKKKVRLIPAMGIGQKQMLLSLYVERLEITTANRKMNISVYLSIDEEGGTYGGYSALIPSFVFDYVS